MSKSDAETTSRRPLWMSVLLLVAAAGAFWAADSVSWGQQRYRTPFSGEKTASLAGSEMHPELVPVALAALAAIAAVVATGGLLRRIVGVVLLAGGGLMIWRSVHAKYSLALPHHGIPSGSAPVGGVEWSPTGPVLMSVGALLLLLAGGLILLRAGRMPAMGAKYSAPGEAKKIPDDPDKRLWDELDADRDPTEDGR